MARRRRRDRDRRSPKVSKVLLVFIVGIAALVGFGYYLVQVGNPCGSFPFATIDSNPLAIHWHAHLMIIIKGQNITFPADIGHGDSGRCIQPLHVHAAASAGGTNVIHIESVTDRSYTLGDFFNVWAATTDIAGPKPVVFNQNQIFNYTSGNGYELRMYVNGNQSNSYGDLVLASHQTIVLVYGKTDSTPWAQYQRISGEPWPFPQLTQ